MGMLMSCPAACTEGKMSTRAAAAACALGLPPPRQSANWNKLCRTGLLYDTRAASTKVMWRTPQANRHLATAQPSVPAPAGSTERQAWSAAGSGGRSDEVRSMGVLTRQACHKSATTEEAEQGPSSSKLGHGELLNGLRQTGSAASTHNLGALILHMWLWWPRRLSMKHATCAQACAVQLSLHHAACRCSCTLTQQAISLLLHTTVP